MTFADLQRGPGHRSLLVLALILTGLVLAGAAGLIGYSWNALNDLEAKQEIGLVEKALRASLSRTADEVRSDAAWDTAYAKTDGPTDLAWLDRSVANYFRVTFRHDLTLVFNRQGSVSYAAYQGLRVSPSRFPDLIAAITPVVRRAQADELKLRASARYWRDRGQDTQGVASSAVRQGPDTFLLGISTVAPSSGFAGGEWPAAVFVSGRQLNSGYLEGLSSDLGIQGVRLADAAPKGEAFAAAPGPGGRAVTFITWRLDHPGFGVIAHAGGWIGAFMALIALTAIVLATRIRALLIRLDANDRSLAASMAELTCANDLAQAANQAKSQFLANMSHEIRTPLNGVLGMAHALERDPLTPVQLERVKVIQASGKALLVVLNDVIDLSRIEARRLDISHSEFDLADVVHSVEDSYRDSATAKGIALGCRVDPEVLGSYLGDPMRIRQILLNLLSNALKFTEQGRVDIEVRAAHGCIAFAVTDQGIGIAPEDMGRLFEKFSQVDGSAARRHTGAGLGLAICRELAELMGGTIGVESNPGFGSTFTVRLPLERVESGAPTTADEPPPVEGAESCPQQPLRVLAAEDNATNRQVLTLMLEPLGAQITMVEDGSQAVEAFRGGRFDIVLMDVQMPVMNGVEATRQIREIERSRCAGPTPILAVSANVMVHQLEEYRAAGMDGHVAKPIEIDRFYAALSGVLEPSQDHRPEAVQAA